MSADSIEDDEPDAGHVDRFIWHYHEIIDVPIAERRAIYYAQWMLMFFRLPAAQRHSWDPFMADRRLFCTWEGKRWRVTGASRLGDVWLASDFAKDCGYDKRVPVLGCSEWGAEA